MIAIAFRFPAGRFHATVWGRHVNEGIPEWPPSPWRILRALVAIWKRTRPDIPEERMRVILGTLANPPCFHLPPATHTHTRHFMPWFKKGPTDRTLIFDTFVALDPEARVAAVWHAPELNAIEQRTLEVLLENLPFLGRAESWCEASLMEGWSISRSWPEWVDTRTGEILEADCRPLADGEDPPQGYEAVRLLVPDGFDPARALDPSAENPNPLCVETARLRDDRRDPARPPGARWRRYVRRVDALTIDPLPPLRRSVPSRPTVARYALDGPVLPPLTETVPLAELARMAVLSKYGGADKRKSAIFSGRDEMGKRLQGHRHAHYLPSDEDGDGRLDHLTIYAAEGLDSDHQEALGNLRVLNPGSGRSEIRLLLLGFGNPGQFNGPTLGAGIAWRSVTPFMLVRHPKQNGKDSPEIQLRLELHRRGLPDPIRVDPLAACHVGGRTIRWLAFRRYRSRGPDPPVGLGFGFRVEFPRPVLGPITLGYAAHFGLGQFVREGVRNA